MIFIYFITLKINISVIFQFSAYTIYFDFELINSGIKYMKIVQPVLTLFYTHNMQ